MYRLNIEQLLILCEVFSTLIYFHYQIPTLELNMSSFSRLIENSWALSGTKILEIPV